MTLGRRVLTAMQAGSDSDAEDAPSEDEDAYQRDLGLARSAAPPRTAADPSLAPQISPPPSLGGSF